jgi:hypothetical protein
MSDPLLSSLCTICRISTPKYTCPKCTSKTCSLPCSRRHKLWSSCSGIRDPTTFKPRSELLTPSGVDHDYNFLHSIETKIERSEKEIVENRGLVGKAELRAARRGVPENNSWERGKRKGKRNGKEHSRGHSIIERNWDLAPGEQLIDNCLRLMGIRVIRAPKGMVRRSENATNWSKKMRSINWQVEWFEDGREERLMWKCMGGSPLGEMWDQQFEKAKRDNMGSEEIKAMKKRKAVELLARHRAEKRVRIDEERGLAIPNVATAWLQDARSGAWNVITPLSTINQPMCSPYVSAQVGPSESDSRDFYLQRVPTPSSFPKVLVRLDPTKPLSDQLRHRAVVEYPTIYVFKKGSPLPDDFMLEKDFLVKTGQQALGDSDDSSSESSDAASEVESKESDSDESSSEDGEISE